MNRTKKLVLAAGLTLLGGAAAFADTITWEGTTNLAMTAATP